VQLEHQSKETCPDHDLPFTYFCETCTVSVCSDCALFSNGHKGHDFKHLRDVYADHAQRVEAEMSRLRERMTSLHARIQEVDANVELVDEQKEAVSAELEAAYEAITVRLRSQLRGKSVALQKQREDIERELKHLTTIFETLEGQLKGATQSQLVAQSEQLVAYVEEQVGPAHRPPSGRPPRGLTAQRRCRGTRLCWSRTHGWSRTTTSSRSWSRPTRAGSSSSPPTPSSVRRAARCARPPPGGRRGAGADVRGSVNRRARARRGDGGAVQPAAGVVVGADVAAQGLPQRQRRGPRQVPLGLRGAHARPQQRRRAPPTAPGAAPCAWLTIKNDHK
jgi:hypothetical protein